MQLQHNEFLLYKTTPIMTISTCIQILFFLGFFIFFFYSSIKIKHILFIIPMIIFCLIRCLDALIITNKRIILRILLSKKSINIESLQKNPTLEIDFYTLKKYEWQRKLLKQDIQSFWLNKATIQFKTLNNPTKTDTLKSIRLSLFSKRQINKIIQILKETSNLNSTIKFPNN
ncbi:hypothetical protein [Acinetobacter defluvii]|uniref:hypothetical protein n=1 Tax=Acinetobacter defluvii TaxID=1871111 RepID=UPI003AF7615F